MSSDYRIYPLGPTFSCDPSWLEELSLNPPAGWEQSRTPTVEDFRAALREWDGCDYQEWVDQSDATELNIGVEKRDSNGVCIDTTFIYIRRYTENHTEEQTSDWLRFNNGGTEWLVEVTERIAQLCGPFLLTTYDAVTIVAAGTTPDIEWVELS